MSEPLWQEAPRLARRHGASAVCRHLGLGYAPLQKRVAAVEGAASQQEADEGGFVELRAAQLLGAPAAQTVLELWDGEGRRLTLRLAAGSELDVEELIAGFIGRGR